VDHVVTLVKRVQKVKLADLVPLVLLVKMQYSPWLHLVYLVLKDIQAMLGKRIFSIKN
jgi:hypothetical protein